MFFVVFFCPAVYTFPFRLRWLRIRKTGNNTSAIKDLNSITKVTHTRTNVYSTTVPWLRTMFISNAFVHVVNQRNLSSAVKSKFEFYRFLIRVFDYTRIGEENPSKDSRHTIHTKIAMQWHSIDIIHTHADMPLAFGEIIHDAARLWGEHGKCCATAHCNW